MLRPALFSLLVCAVLLPTSGLGADASAGREDYSTTVSREQLLCIAYDPESQVRALLRIELPNQAPTVLHRCESSFMDPQPIQDTREMVFTQFVDHTPSIKLLHLKTGAATSLVEGDRDGIPFSPSPSSDGRRVVYSLLQEHSANPAMYVLDRVTGAKEKVGDGWMPAWSPDGTKIAYVSLDSFHAKAELMIVDVGTRKTTRLGKAMGAMPAWSPDGRRIAYAAHLDTRDEKQRGVYIINADGSGQRQITHSIDESPRWSSDGERVFFTGELHPILMRRRSRTSSR